ncbi:PAS domain-containing protein [Methylobacterium sp. SI9]|uniref:PAS domain-containing protein n=1 Tax=Methylobacterium guangdongense TaxID=3138811 RepID=UPI00313CFB39
MPVESVSRPNEFPQAGGEMGALVRAHDWSRTPLGPIAGWPAALKVTLNLVLASPESMFLAWGPDLTFFFNDTYRPILGPRLSWALGAPMPELWSDVWAQVRPSVELALSGTASRFDDLPLSMARHGVGEETWWSFSHSPVRDEHDAVVGLFCVVTETTQRVLTERTLRAREAELLLITDSLPLLIAFIDRGLVYRFANRAYEDWFAMAPEDVVGRHVRDLLDEAGYASRKDAFAKALSGEPARLELDWPCVDGSPRVADIRYLPRRAEDGTVDGFYVFVLDVTDRKQVERMLRETNEDLERRVAERTQQLDQVWRHSRDMLCVADFGARFVSLNPAWTATLGWSAEEMMAPSFLDLVHPDDRDATVTAMSGLERGESVVGFENRYRHKNGDYRWLAWNAVPRDGLIYSVVRDVTFDKSQAAALATAETALRQAQKLEAIGQLTGGVAHDFNNLLTVIKSSTDLLKRPELPDARRLRYVGAISDTVDRAAKLTAQLLAFARRQALKPEVFEVGRSLGAIGDMIGTLTGSRIAFHVRVAGPACYVDADPSQFDTAIVNMAVNARDAMSGEGDLVIAMAEAAGVPAIRGHRPVPGPYVAIAITDTGAGIAQADIERIFEPFFTTKGVGHGTGLGLSQVFGFAKQSGGDVAVESALGQGTTFTLYLPRVEAPLVAGDIDVEPEEFVDGHGTCVLVVEDNVEVGTFATQSLAELGYGTVWAANAAEALAELARDAGRFDVVFSDVVMPGMDGIELGREIRRLYNDLPVVLTSGYSHVLAQTGTSGFQLIHKPYSIEEMSRVLRKAASRRRRITPEG